MVESPFVYILLEKLPLLLNRTDFYFFNDSCFGLLDSFLHLNKTTGYGASCFTYCSSHCNLLYACPFAGILKTCPRSSGYTLDLDIHKMFNINIAN